MQSHFANTTQAAAIAAVGVSTLVVPNIVVSLSLLGLLVSIIIVLGSGLLGDSR